MDILGLQIPRGDMMYRLLDKKSSPGQIKPGLHF
jgi:hypothetical protein